jgi:manganese/iron transport system permease protein
MMALGSLLGAAVGVAGYYLSFHLGTASGGTIVLLATALFVVAFVASPTHGLLGHRLRRHPQHAGASPAVDPPTGHQHGPLAPQ